ncbi:hypothetical protein D0Z70_00705 [Sphingobium terrigena]|uniref:Uncharacterized protein n=1 Tax=Sphingobium terrigena TaxID=2304063 RepID=A0A418YY49_9SPHN|nr:hypothetical protein [Sphingobium terrigena]RJG57779.1 hypothetical protein D0Z70_00705 [Sphingobium terrigena]
MEKTNYSGMTLNERLFAAGILDEFDAAIDEKSRERVVELLGAVEVDNPHGIANSLLGPAYECWFCGEGIEQNGRQALAIGLSDLWSDQCDEPPTQIIYAHFDCAQKRMEGSSMALEQDVLFPSVPDT